MSEPAPMSQWRHMEGGARTEKCHIKETETEIQDRFGRSVGQYYTALGLFQT